MSILKIVRFNLFYALLLRNHSKLNAFGNPPCQWTLDPENIGPESIVYSAGAGKDISFEKELINATGTRIILLDPTPIGIKTAATAAEENIEFHPYGLSDRNGTLEFGQMDQCKDGSYSANCPAVDRGLQSLPCRTLTSIMKENEHSRIDLLKMDIEGCEYGVINDICSASIPVDQICVEFHHWFKPHGRRSQTIRAIWQLIRSGYSLVHVNGWDHTFLKKQINA